MSHRVSLEEGRKKTNYALECQELAKKGLYRSGRLEQKRKIRENKYNRFIEMLKRRGGFYKPKEEKQNVRPESS